MLAYGHVPLHLFSIDEIIEKCTRQPAAVLIYMPTELYMHKY